MITLIVLGVLFLIGLIVALCVTRLRVPTKGERGENAVARELGETIVGQQYVINGLLISDDKGYSCQIDHVYINKSGIWVIETKNYAGLILGDENQREWTQVLASGEIKNQFYNPIKQNRTHIYRLSEYLNVNNVFHNVVVFLRRADISRIISGNVYSIEDLQSIKTQDTGICLSVEQMESYYNILLTLKNNSAVSKEEHVKNIQEMQSRFQQGLCPRCGAKLVLREGKYGQFYGCSNYPNCKFTKNIEED